MVFFRLKEVAEFELGSSVSQAVITVPSYFSFPQRAAIMDAAKIAGLRTLRILSPATAAAIAYHHTMGPTFESRNVLILDFGAEGLDSCLFTCEEEVMDVKATMGDPGLGGLEIDECLVTHFALEFKRRHDKGIYPWHIPFHP